MCPLYRNQSLRTLNSRMKHLTNAEVGLRPLRAVGSTYEPEAVGVIRAYAPEGMRKGGFASLSHLFNRQNSFLRHSTLMPS
jgi:hypothetical protein